MIYNFGIPDEIKPNLTNEARSVYNEIYCKVYEGAGQSNDIDEEKEREQKAHRIAWAALTADFEPGKDGLWRRKQQSAD